jgi:hypothetical protein
MVSCRDCDVRESDQKATGKMRKQSFGLKKKIPSGEKGPKLLE